MNATTATLETDAAHRGKTVARVPLHAARLLLGLIFFVFGLNGFLHFIPMNQPMPDKVQAFMGGMMGTGYMIPLIFATQAISGALLLVNRFVPLALALLAPVLLNIILFHVFLAPSGLPMAIVVLALELYLAWAYRHAFAPMLAPRVHPNACPR